MKLFKRIISVILLAALLFGFVPPMAIPVHAEQVEEVEPVVVDVTEETTDTIPESSGVTKVTRAQWIQLLVNTFEYTIGEEITLDNYYTDLSSDSDYYDEVQIAVYYGLIDILPNSALRLDEPATREFAAQTLNACMGYLPTDSSGYTYSEYQEVTYPDDIQVAIDRGWFELVDGDFLPEQAITLEEQAIMIDDANSYLESMVIDEFHDNQYTFKDDITVIQNLVEIQVEEEYSVITVYGSTEEIAPEEKFVVFSGGLAIPYQAVSVEQIDGNTVITASDLYFEDAIEYMDVQLEMDTIPTNFYAAEDTDLVFVEERTGEEYASAEAAAYAMRTSSYAVPIPKYTKTIELSDAVKLSLSVELKNSKICVDTDLGLVESKCSVWLDTNVEVSGKLSCDLTKALDDPIEVYIGGYEIPGVGGLSVSVKIDVTGSISVVKKYHMKAGFTVGYNIAKFKKIESCILKITDKGSSVNAEISAKIYLEAKFGLYGKALPVKGYFYAESGFKTYVRYTTYSDIEGYCTHFAAHLFAEFGIKAEAKFGSDKLSMNWKKTPIKEENTPVKISAHYEDGKYTGNCTRAGHAGTTTGDPSIIADSGYVTHYDSTYFSSGLSSGGSSTGYNSGGEPVIIYSYSLDEDNNATITKYSGNATTLTIPLTLDGYPVVAIGEKAFKDNTILRTVIMQDNIVSIDPDAFENCTNLRNVTFSDNLTVLGERAFANCGNLTYVRIPKTLSAVRESGLTKEGPFSGSGLVSVVIEEGMTSIPGYLFSDAFELSDVTIPDTVTEIQVYAFERCNSLSDIELPSYLTTLGEGAFAECSSLTEIIIPQTLLEVTEEGLSKAGPFTRSTLISAVIEEGMTSIPEFLFSGASQLSDVSIPDTVTEIQPYVFEKCSSLADVKLPSFLTVLGEGAFAECSSLTEIKIPKTISEVMELGISTEGPFMKSGLENAIIDEGMIAVPEYLFADANNLKTVVIPETVRTLKRSVFENCTLLDPITIPKSVTKIEKYAFVGCTSLVEISIPESVVELGNAVFEGCTALKEVVIPETITEIPGNMFYGCSSLEKIHIPGSVNMIGGGAFENCISLNEIVWPDGITIIGDSAFKDCDSLSTLTLPTSLEEMGSRVFYDCDALKEFIMPDAVTSVGSKVCYDCDALITVVFPDSVKEIGSKIFYDCDALTSVRLSMSLTEIPESAFEHCDVLESVTIPRNVTKICEKAFKDCVKLTGVFIPKATTEIDTSAFSYPDVMTIFGLSGTYAETFAGENGFAFEERIIPATEALLDQTAVKLFKGKKLSLKLTVNPEDFTDDIIWKSSNSDIVTVSEEGELKGVAVGTATIKVTVGSVSASCKVTVVQPVTSITLNKTSLTLDAMQTYQLTAKANPSGAENREIVWATSDDTIASVTEEGLVTAHRKGTAIITATAVDGSGEERKCTVTVANNGYIVTDPTQMESSHNYPDSCSDFWIYTHEQAEKLEVTFDSQTMMEDGFDYLYIFDGEGNLVGEYTGSELADQMIEISGDTVKIQLNTDGSGNEWGFKVSGIHAVMHIHDYSTKVVAPTCTEQGYTVYTCECGDTYNGDYAETIPHEFGQWETELEATCTEAGRERRECSTCGATETIATELANHSFTNYVSDGNATCTEDGTKTAVCDNCDEEDTVADEGSATGHAWDSGTVTKEPTAEEEGEKAFTCTNCSETRIEIIPVIPDEPCTHDEVEMRGQKDATCTETGYTGDKVCLLCGEMLMPGNTVPKTGHSFTSYVSDGNATCTEDGTKTAVCDNCDEEDAVADEGSATGHAWNEGEITIEPTVDAEGEITYTCNTCGATKTETIDPLPDEPEERPCTHETTQLVGYLEASCTSTGYTGDKVCADCGETVEKGSELPKTGHTFGEWKQTVAPTEETEGKEVRTCVCGETEERAVAKLPHTHNYSEKVTAPTCTENGYTTYTCACGDTYTGDEVAAKCHTEVIDPEVAANCTEDGLTEGKHCSVCDAVLVGQNVVKAKGHTEVIDPAVESSCSAEGKAEGKHCAVCDEILVKQESVAKLAHTWSKWEITKKPTADAEGLRKHTCLVCETTETETLRKLSIAFKDVKADQYFALPVDWAVQNNVTTGTSATTFSPDAECTRAQVVTFLWRAAGQPEPTSSKNPFTDVKEDQYYYKAVLWAVENEITSGTSATTFSPDASCTRAQVATFLWRAQGKPDAAGTAEAFSDVPENQYYYTAVLWAVENGVTNGMGEGKFAPDATCTRGQIVTFLYRALA